ncbi:MAG: hypothetical protein VKJ06_07185 [Vampirovibrionales bacterium]|nr:hypothetical protein [Vampirovibrionales bacterium]
MTATTAIYGFWGDDAYRRSRALKALRTQVLNPETQSLCHRVLESPSLAQLDEVLNTPALLMGGPLFIEVHGFTPLAQAAKSKADETLLAQLIETLTALDVARSCVAFVSQKADGKLKLTKKLNEFAKLGKATVQTFETPPPWKPEDAVEILMALAQAEGVPVSRPVAQQLVLQVGHDSAQLMRELEKLQVYAGNRTVTPDDVVLLCGVSDQLPPVWSAWVTQRWTPEAYERLQTALLAMPAAQVMARASGHVNEQYRLKLLASQGMPPQQVAELLGRHPYRTKLDIDALRPVPLPRLAQLRATAVLLEGAFKSGQMSDAQALDRLLNA